MRNDNDRPLDLTLGDQLRVRILTSAEDTDGRYDLVDATMPAGAATPLHRHSRYEERLFVLEGGFVAHVGDRRVDLGPGDVLTIPLHTPHRLSSPNGGRALTISSPAAFAELLERTASPAGASTDFDPEQFARVAGELGDEILGPPGAVPAGS